jgi:hypothetical protein
MNEGGDGGYAGWIVVLMVRSRCVVQVEEEEE